MIKVIWLEPALEQLETILAYIAERNESAAANLYAAVKACTDRLPDHPFLYRPGRTPGTREAVVHPNYIVVYRVSAEAVEIVGVVHARQLYP